MAWHGGQRGTGPVRLTQEVMHRANTGTHASTKTHSHTPLLPMQTSVIRVKRRARTTEIGALNACMWPDEHSRAREQKCGTHPELCRLMLLYVGHDA